MSVVGIVAAAGRGERFGGEPKQLCRVAGRMLLEWALWRLREGGIDELVVALPEDLLARVRGELAALEGVHWIAGGPDRQASVALCLEAIAGAGGAWERVAVHDAARPAVAPADVRATLEAARAADGAVLGRPLGDTLKTVHDDLVTGTLERGGLFRAETPQVFRREVLEEAHRRARGEGFLGTDEASLVERLPGARIQAVVARFANPKVTRPGDLEVAASLLEVRER